MSSFLNSHGGVLATVLAVSAGTVILVDHILEKYFPIPTNQFLPDQEFQPSKQNLRSCFSSGERKKEKRKVHFAEDVKEPIGQGEEYREVRREPQRVCTDFRRSEILEFPATPANRAALYTEILKDRPRRTEFYC